MKNSNANNEWVAVNLKCNKLVEDMRKLVLAQNSSTRGKKKRFLLSILMRQCSNLYAVAILTKVSVAMSNSVLFKLPIGLLLRNCYMDCLLGLYLSSVTEA